MVNDKKIALYVRVSTEEQVEEGYSIDAQFDNLRTYCNNKGYIVVKEYKDEGLSAKNIKGRKGILSLMEDAKKNIFSVVLVWKTSRLSRDQSDLLNIVKLLNQNNVDFISMTEQFDTTTPSGRAMFQMLGTFAEFERNQLAENVKLGMRQKARQGEWCGGTILGYDLEDRLLIPNENETLIVQRIFELYCNGKGLKSIANQLNHEGYKTKKGNSFSLNAVRIILHNPTYTGKIRWNKQNNWSDMRRKGKQEPIIADGKHKPIISMETWEKAQTFISSRTFIPSRLYTGKFPLAGFLRCPRCDAGMVGTNHTRHIKSGTVHYRNYVCGNFHYKGSSVCNSNTVKADIIESKVVERLTQSVQQPEIIREVIRKVNLDNKKKIAPLKNEFRILEKEIHKLEANLEKTFQLYYEDIINGSILKSRKELIEQEQKRLHNRMDEIKLTISGDTDSEIPEKEILKIITDFANVFVQADVDKQKHFLRTLVKDITLTPERDLKNLNLNIQLKIPQSQNSKKSLQQAKEGSDELPYTSNISHLFMIRFPPHNLKSPINLLHQNKPHQLMRICHLPER
jgi:site-specific DNA recombinase